MLNMTIYFLFHGMVLFFQLIIFGVFIKFWVKKSFLLWGIFELGKSSWELWSELWRLAWVEQLNCRLLICQFIHELNCYLAWARAQLSLTLCDARNCSLPGSSVHGIFQARTLEWVVIFSSRGSSWPRDRNHISYVSCIAGRFFSSWAIGEAQIAT